VHGSAPDIAARHRQSDRDDRLVRHGVALFLRPREAADRIEKAIADVLASGLRTPTSRATRRHGLDLGDGRRHRLRADQGALNSIKAIKPAARKAPAFYFRKT